MPKTLPELPYFSLSGLAKIWECSEEDILHYGIAGKLKICALSAGWELQEGYYIDDGLHIPIKERLSNKELLPLKYPALREILSSGQATDPEFVLEVDDALDQAEDGEKYEQFLSSVIIAEPPQRETAARENPRSKIIVRKSDLVIRKKDADRFLSTFAKKDHEVSQDDPMPQNKVELPIATAVKPQKQKRHRELHDLIGKIIIELGFKNKKAPSLKIWNHIHKHQEKYECIRGVGDREIDWISYRGFPQIMKRERFNTVVSEYNTGKRPYPEN